MESKNINLSQLYSEADGLEKTSTKINLGLLFAENKGWYLNEYSLFLAHFNSIPNLFREVDIDCKKANKWFVENYQSEIKDFHFNKRYFNQNKNAEEDDLFYILHEDLIVYFDTNLSVSKLLFRKTEISKIEIIEDGIKKFKRKSRSKPEISLLVNTRFGLETKSLEIQFSCNSFSYIICVHCWNEKFAQFVRHTLSVNIFILAFVKALCLLIFCQPFWCLD